TSTDLGAALSLLLDTPAIASKRWVFEQYDSTVQANTALGPGGDAGVFRVAGERFGLAVTLDCNSRLVALDPYEGGKAAVAEAARNVACTGAVPLGITDCLNFGNPEKPDVFFQFTEACRGISDACRAFEIPVTGGNVSFYNESPAGAIDPTPVIGLVGLLDRVDQRIPSHFQSTGDGVVIFGRTAGALGGSAYWAEVRGCVGGNVPRVDLAAERALQRLLADAAREGLLHSAHDCSTGGLAVALAEAAIGGPYAASGFGAALDLRGYGAALDDDALLYGEDQGRIVATFAFNNAARLAALARRHGVPGYGAGRVGAANGALRIHTGHGEYRWEIGALRQAFFDAIPRRMSAATAGGR
ncbi:MAG: AIR synthase related protein, partial [Gemmatimonadales bacterium]